MSPLIQEPRPRGDIFQRRNSLPGDFGVAGGWPGARRGAAPPSQAELSSRGAGFTCHAVRDDFLMRVLAPLRGQEKGVWTPQTHLWTASLEALIESDRPGTAGRLQSHLKEQPPLSTTVPWGPGHQQPRPWGASQIDGDNRQPSNDHTLSHHLSLNPRCPPRHHCFWSH